MPIGTQMTVAQMNQQLTSFAVQHRNISDQVQTWARQIAAIGSAGLQAVPYNMSQPDADAMIQKANYFLNLAGVFYGTATVGAAFNFDNAFLGLYAGQ